MEDIENLRGRIHEINLHILELLAERGTLAQEIGKVKARLGLDLSDVRREAEMLEDLTKANPGPYPDHAIRAIFKAIFRASLHLQEVDADSSKTRGR